MLFCLTQTLPSISQLWLYLIEEGSTYNDQWSHRYLLSCQNHLENGTMHVVPIIRCSAMQKAGESYWLARCNFVQGVMTQHWQGLVQVSLRNAICEFYASEYCIYVSIFDVFSRCSYNNVRCDIIHMSRSLLLYMVLSAYSHCTAY